MKTKKNYQQPEITVVEIEEQQVIAASPDWNAQSIDLELELMKQLEEGYAD
ncbi:MAG: hypothetical protein KBT33_03760 [Prevotellaceae bacterium]|nr:hypothetical protein [Candidatus Minthosoma equi]